MKHNFYSREELESLGLKKIGQNVKVSKRCSIYGASQISLGDNVRIDDFSLLSGDITVGSYVHISAYSALYGGGKIIIGNFCGVSPRCTLLSASDDFSGEYMISPMVPSELTNVRRAPIIMEDYSQLGTGCTVLPGVTLHEGAAAGACSLLLNDLSPWSIHLGIPCKYHSNRKRTAKDISLSLKEL